MTSDWQIQWLKKVFGFSCNCLIMSQGMRIWLSYREMYESSLSQEKKLFPIVWEADVILWRYGNFNLVTYWDTFIFTHNISIILVLYVTPLSFNLYYYPPRYSFHQSWYLFLVTCYTSELSFLCYIWFTNYMVCCVPSSEHSKLKVID